MGRLASAALVLLLLVGLVVWLAQRPDRAGHAGAALSLPDPDAVAELVIHPKGGEPIALRRAEGGWRFATDAAAADGEAVAHLLRDLAGMRVTRVVTRSAGRGARFGLGEGCARVILRDADGARLAAVDVGDQSTDLVSTYVRLEGEPTVYAVNRALGWQLRRSAGSWRADGPATEAK